MGITMYSVSYVFVYRAEMYLVSGLVAVAGNVLVLRNTSREEPMSEPPRYSRLRR